MKKTIDFSDNEIEIIEKYKEAKEIKTFSATIRSIIRNVNNASSSSDISTAISKIDKKIDTILKHFAPTNAGEIK